MKKLSFFVGFIAIITLVCFFRRDQWRR